MNNYKNIFIFFLISIYILIGGYLSLTNGITSDESFEQLNWIENIKGVKNLLVNGNYDKFLEYQDKYHGIAFHYISQPIQFVIYKFISELNNSTDYAAFLMSKHLVVFLFFFISSIFFYKLIFKITSNQLISILSLTTYLLYPYLFGHSLFNMKDIPFLSLWIITTYYSLKITENIFLENKINYKNIIFFSFLTSFLISIRILGFIIFFQFLITLIILFNYKNINFFIFLKKYSKHLLIFLTSLSIFVYLLNPVFWLNPLELKNSIVWMSQYFNNICTLTLGDCMSSLSLPSSYYFIWLFFKLPIIVIFGLILFPVVEQKIFKNSIISIYYGTLLFSSLFIIFLFILLKVNIYDEIRHVMFILPLLIIVGLTNLFFFNKKISYYLTIITSLFFLIENINLNPYQYTWLNSFAKITNIEKNFEIDYWGVSGKNLQKKIIHYVKKNNISKDTCIYGDEFVKEFLIKDGFSCFKRYQQLDSAKIKPAIAYKNLRNAKRSNPRDCKLVWNEHYKYSFYNKKISVGTLWFCN